MRTGDYCGSHALRDYVVLPYNGFHIELLYAVTTKARAQLLDTGFDDLLGPAAISIGFWDRVAKSEAWDAVDWCMNMQNRDGLHSAMLDTGIGIARYAVRFVEHYPDVLALSLIHI